jgi:hypothetical protein
MQQTLSRVTPTAISALALLRDFQPPLRRHLGESLLDIHRSQHHHAPTSESLLGEPRKLLECSITGIPKQLDCSRRLAEPYPAWQVMNNAAPTGARGARAKSAKVMVRALDRRGHRPKQVEAIFRLPPAKRYIRFIKQSADWRKAKVAWSSVRDWAVGSDTADDPLPW